MIVTVVSFERAKIHHHGRFVFPQFDVAIWNHICVLVTFPGALESLS